MPSMQPVFLFFDWLSWCQKENRTRWFSSPSFCHSGFAISTRDHHNVCCTKRILQVVGCQKRSAGRATRQGAARRRCCKTTTKRSSAAGFEGALFVALVIGVDEIRSVCRSQNSPMTSPFRVWMQERPWPGSALLSKLDPVMNPTSFLASPTRSETQHLWLVNLEIKIE